jgi:hypothetical protein
MDAAALFGNLSRRCDGMKMERQEENKQQDSGAHKAPESVGVLHAGIKHGPEPKQCCFRCQWKKTAIEVTDSRSSAGFL